MPPAHLQARLAAPNGAALGGRQPLGLVGSTATSAGPGYRLQSMYWLITWSQVDAKFDEPVAEQKLRGLVPSAEQGLRVKLAREEHDDGGPHYHAFVAFGKTPSIRNAQVKLAVGENKPHFTKIDPRMKHVGRADKRAHGSSATTSRLAGTPRPATRPTGDSWRGGGGGRACFAEQGRRKVSRHPARIGHARRVLGQLRQAITVATTSTWSQHPSTPLPGPPSRTSAPVVWCSIPARTPPSSGGGTRS